MKPIIRIANAQDWDAIARLNHDTFALELGQYTPNEQGRLIDRQHETNLYIVAYVQDELAGMLSITRPSTAPFSTLKRMAVVSEEMQRNLPKTAEIRLLAVKPAQRGQGLFAHLMLAAIKTCYQHGIDRVLISAIANRVETYAFMGFQAIAEPVVEGKAVYVPMIITRQTLEASPYSQKLAQLDSGAGQARYGATPFSAYSKKPAQLASVREPA
jgi:predicted GNAT family N-acyltransferase